MKRYFILLIFSFLSYFLHAQNSYWTATTSYILSSSNASYENPLKPGDIVSIADAPRFTLWLNFNMFYNYNFGKNIGLLSGFGLNNIGLITKELSTITDSTSDDFNKDVSWKRRAYTITVPLALKIGKVDNGFHFLIGGQYDYLFHYKEKEFLSTGKRKMTEWFSKRVNNFIPSVFVGVGFKGGVSILFTFGLKDFLNKDYSYLNESGVTIKPYESMNSKIFHISLFINNPFDSFTDTEITTRQIAVL